MGEGRQAGMGRRRGWDALHAQRGPLPTSHEAVLSGQCDPAKDLTTEGHVFAVFPGAGEEGSRQRASQSPGKLYRAAVGYKHKHILAAGIAWHSRLKDPRIKRIFGENKNFHLLGIQYIWLRTYCVMGDLLDTFWWERHISKQILMQIITMPHGRGNGERGSGGNKKASSVGRGGGMGDVGHRVQSYSYIGRISLEI